MCQPYTTELRASGLYTSTPYFRLPIHYKEFKNRFFKVNTYRPGTQLVECSNRRSENNKSVGFLFKDRHIEGSTLLHPLYRDPFYNGEIPSMYTQKKDMDLT